MSILAFEFNDADRGFRNYIFGCVKTAGPRATSHWRICLHWRALNRLPPEYGIWSAISLLLGSIIRVQGLHVVTRWSCSWPTISTCFHSPTSKSGLVCGREREREKDKELWIRIVENGRTERVRQWHKIKKVRKWQRKGGRDRGRESGREWENERETDERTREGEKEEVGG